MEMENVLSIVFTVANVFLLAFVSFVGGRLCESYRQQEKALDKEMENLKQIEQMLRLVKLAASKSESATEKSEPAPEPAVKEQNTEK